MKRTKLAFVAGALLGSVILGSCAGVPSSGGAIRIAGAYALSPMVTRWAAEYQRVRPGVIFEISQVGAGRGMDEVLAGEVDLGMVSRSVTADEKSQGAYAVPVVRDAVLPTLNSENPVMAEVMAQGLSQEILAGIFLTGEVTTWGEVVGKPEVTDEVHVLTRSDVSGAAELWALYLGGAAQSDLLGIGAMGDTGLIEAVQRDPLAIGYNNLGYAFDQASGNPVAGTLVAPIDANGNGSADPDELVPTRHTAAALIADGKYPSPPARDLLLVTLGKPDGLVQEFILWILTDGQPYVGEIGYVTLTPEQVEASLDLVR